MSIQSLQRTGGAVRRSRGMAAPQPRRPLSLVFGLQELRLATVRPRGYCGRMGPSIREADPSELRLPPSRSSGADPWKLHQQIRQFGSSKDGMPPILVYEDPDGVLEIIDGVTRATRMAKLAPGATVPVVVIGRYRRSRAGSLRVGDRL